MTRRALVLASSLVALVSAASVLARSGGPPPNRVELCGTGMSCVGCHVTTAPSSPTVTLELTSPTPSSFPPAFGYTPGGTYHFLLSVVETAVGRCSHPARTESRCTPPLSEPADACRFGFQLTTIEVASCAGASRIRAGCFNVIQPGTQRLCDVASPFTCSLGCPPGDPALEFIEHDACGYIPDVITATSQSKSWEFEWIAPPAGTGDVLFAYAVNSANGDATNTLDNPTFYTDIWREETVAACDLMTNSITSIAPPPPFYKTDFLFDDDFSCDEPLDPGTPDRMPSTTLVPMFTTAAPPVSIDSAPVPDPVALTVYKVFCPCTGTLRLYKDRSVVPTSVEAEWTP